MKYIILCGGIGKRCNQYSLPKPLNYINGKHLIEYIVESIPSTEIYIVYNAALDAYNIKEILINKFKKITFRFSSLHFLSRGAVETALIGIQNFDLGDDNILFIDNDNVHEFPNFNEAYATSRSFIPNVMENGLSHCLPSTNQHFSRGCNYTFGSVADPEYGTLVEYSDVNKFNNNFICYGHDYVKTNFSFITINDNNSVIAIEEKIKISDNYCCGLYGFKNKDAFLNLANELINRNMKTRQEFYFSQLYKLIIERDEQITPIFVKNTHHLGTYEEIVHNINNLTCTKLGICNGKKLRICFDLDNTLVTYPTIPNDYTSVKPIKRMIDQLNQFKSDGHEIIIYTARRMLTHSSNVGKVLKDIAMITFNTLEKFNIYYDEIIFGKPIADIYIDDRAINPYYNNMSLFGFFNRENEIIPNKIENNKYNTIEKHVNVISKVGPYRFMRGELHFYENIPNEITHFFPKLSGYNKYDDKLEIKIDFIDGIPLYFLYSNKTLTFSIIDKLFDSLTILHNTNIPIIVSESDVKSNYFDKLKNRFNKNDYYFEDADVVFDEILQNLELHYSASIVPVIHGDFWFSNIMLTYNDELKFIDMKGQITDILTLNGDMYYDYGKMYQSILGYDLILNRDSIDSDYLAFMHEYFLKKCNNIGLNIDYLRWVTKSLIFGTFHSLNTKTPKGDVWKLIKSI